MDLFNQLLLNHPIQRSIYWVIVNYIEITGTITGFIYILYSIEGNKLLWLYGFLSSLLYVYVFFDSGLYADMSINFYYVVVSIYGWIHWTFRKEKLQQEISISLTKRNEALVIALITIALFFIITFILKKYTNSTVPLWDAFISAASITATWMLARKMLEQWLIWIVVDGISVGLCIYKGLFPTAILFFVYTLLAYTGYIKWKKLWKQQQTAL